MSLIVICQSVSRMAEARALAERCGVAIVESAAPEDCAYALTYTDMDVRLRSLRGEHGDILADFCAGSAAHRRKFGGGKNQMIAKAVGIKGKLRPVVYDMTAGLGGDAFVLASLGCDVHLFERNPVVHTLLSDGLRRALLCAEAGDAELGKVIGRMHLASGDGIEWLRSTNQKPPVVYLDPMFPERKKSASVKKEMQAFHEVVGSDDDAAALLDAALQAGQNRVAVKRPRLAPPIEGHSPSYQLEGKSSRYDIYALRKLE